MRGVPPRSLTNRELIRHCANTLELTTTGMSHEFQIELLRRFTALADPNEAPGGVCAPLSARTQRALIDPEAD